MFYRGILGYTLMFTTESPISQCYPSSSVVVLCVRLQFFIFYFLKTTTQIAAIILVWLICRIKRNYIMKFTILSPYGLTRDTNMKKGQTFKNPLHYPHTLGKKIHSWVWWHWCHQTSISWSLGGGSGTWVGLI